MEKRPVLALVLVQVLFGLLPVAGKIAFRDFAPLSVGALRVLVGGIVLLVVAGFVAKRKVDLRRDGKQVAILSLFGVVLNQVLFVVGLSKTTAVNVGLIITSIPVFTYAIAVIIGRETWGPRRAFGLLLALTGVVYLIGLSGFEAGLDNAIGDILVTLNCLSFSIYLVLAKPMATRVNPLSLTAWLFLFAAVVMVPLGLWAGLGEQTTSASTNGWWVMAFIIVGPTVLTYVLNATALRTVSSSTVAVFIYIQPIFAALSAWYWLDEPLSWKLIPAAVLVFLGVGIVARRSAVRADANNVVFPGME